MTFIPGIMFADLIPSPFLNATSDAYWSYNTPPISYNSSPVKWLVDFNVGGNLNNSFNAIGFDGGFRPDDVRFTIKYTGDLSSCNIRINIVQILGVKVVDVDEPFNSGQTKTVTYSMASQTRDMQYMTFGVVEADTAPTFEISEITFISN